MVNLLVTLQNIGFFDYMIDLLRLFEKRSFVLSNEHENQNMATIGTTNKSTVLQWEPKWDLATPTSS